MWSALQEGSWNHRRRGTTILALVLIVVQLTVSAIFHVVLLYRLCALNCGTIPKQRRVECKALRLRKHVFRLIKNRLAEPDPRPIIIIFARSKP